MPFLLFRDFWKRTPSNIAVKTDHERNDVDCHQYSDADCLQCCPAHERQKQARKQIDD